MSIALNPGSGAVEGATLAEAKKNVKAFVKELIERYGPGWGIVDNPPAKDVGDGRWEFVVGYGEKGRFEIEMPGLPLEQVRFTGADDQDVWAFPRLYVDGSSWLWMFAISVMNPEELD